MSDELNTPWSWTLGKATLLLKDCHRYTIAETRLCGPSDRDKASMAVLSVNSYAKHCGEKARELAEADLLGEALVTLRELMNAARNYEVARTTAGKHGYQEAVERWTSADLSAASLLAKLPKESK